MNGGVVYMKTKLIFSRSGGVKREKRGRGCGQSVATVAEGGGTFGTNQGGPRVKLEH